MLRHISITFLGLLIAVSATAIERTYQVTGPILEVKEDSIVVDKKGEKWEISKDVASMIHGELKKGNKVTIKYKMIATEVDAKEDAPKKEK